eukprot:gene3804-2690_t
MLSTLDREGDENSTASMKNSWLISYSKKNASLKVSIHIQMSVLNTLLPLSKYSPAIQSAAKAAIEAHKRAYQPYSNFSVGAALLHLDDTVTAGCNYENCTLQSCCAERCAIVRANIEGRRTAKAVAVYGRSMLPAASGTPGDALCTPCGLCRQLLVEVADLSQNYDSFEVVLVSHDQGHAKVVKLADLIPEKFGPADIGMNLQELSLAVPRLIAVTVTYTNVIWLFCRGNGFFFVTARVPFWFIPRGVQEPRWDFFIIILHFDLSRFHSRIEKCHGNSICLFCFLFFFDPFTIYSELYDSTIVASINGCSNPVYAYAKILSLTNFPRNHLRSGLRALEETLRGYFFLNCSFWFHLSIIFRFCVVHGQCFFKGEKKREERPPLSGLSVVNAKRRP